jgi:hypothetical protein
MLSRTKFGSLLLAAILVLGILPIRPLVIALATGGPAAQQCLLHGPDCTCKSHCDRTKQHSHEAPEAAVKAAACHREPAGEAPLVTQVSSQPGDEAPASTTECVMTSCGKEAPMLLTSQGEPYLTATLVAAPLRDPRFEAAPIVHPAFPLSLEASPPTPPPES